MTVRSIRRHRPFSGHTVGECILAFAILVPIAALVSKIGIQTQQSLRDSVLAADSRWELTNAREVIGAWKFDDVTVANIQSIERSENPALQASHSKWLAVVDEVQEPIPSKCVRLSLLRTPPGSDAAIEVGPLTFWVFKP